MKKVKLLTMFLGASLWLVGCGTQSVDEEPQKEEEQQKADEADSHESSTDGESEEQPGDDAESDEPRTDGDSEEQPGDDGQSDEPRTDGDSEEQPGDDGQSDKPRTDGDSEEQPGDDGQSDEPRTDGDSEEQPGDDGQTEVESQCPAGLTGDNCQFCFNNMAGKDCDIIIRCVNGVPNTGIEGDGHCNKCYDDWSGVDCDIANECQNGDANTGLEGDGSCMNCYDDWSGSKCDIAPKCQYGEIVSGVEGDGSCSECDELHFGKYCDQCEDSHYAGQYCDECNPATTYGSECTVYGTMQDAAGNTYKTAVIDGHIWMAENMNMATGTYYYPGNNQDNQASYGLLYDFDTAQTVCPEGWHLPSSDEYQTLINYVNDNRTSDTTFLALLANSTAWKSYSQQGTNEFGFAAMPAGRYDAQFTSYGVGQYGRWWTSTATNNDNAKYFYIYGGFVKVLNFTKVQGSSVRCVQD